MTTQNTTSTLTSRVEHGRELVLERIFSAPRQLVYDAFSQAEHLRHWWAPQGWTVPHCTVDFREGGRWHYCMKCTDPDQGDFYGMESWGLGIYETIDAPSQIVYTDYFSDANGTINESMPSTRAMLTFEDADGGRTRVISRSSYATEEALQSVLEMGMLQGITQTWDRLEEHLAATRA